MSIYSNTKLVPVISSDNHPLMPCHPARARKLIRVGKAKKHWVHNVYCIKMTNRTLAESVVQTLKIGIDTGSSGTGIVVIDDNNVRRVLAAIQIKHRGKQITRDMIQRRNYRRTRRNRLRYRKPRFNNRCRPAGWLPPSLMSNLNTIHKWTDLLCKLYPVAVINIEYNKFDMQKMVNPKTHGVEYQHGTLHGWQVKNYLMDKHNGTCAYCDKKTGRMEIDHVVPKSNQGSNRISNLVLACCDCNENKSNLTLEQFLYNDSKRISNIRAQLKQSLSGAAHVNVMLPRLVRELNEKGYDVIEHDAATTSWNRKQLGIPKSHCYDAMLLGDVTGVSNVPIKVMMVTCVARQTHQKAKVNKYGTPRGKQYRKYCSLHRREQSKTKTPGHSTKQQRYGDHNIKSGDIAQVYNVTNKKFYLGRCSIMNGRSVILIGTKPSISGNIETAQLIARNRGFNLKYETVELQKS